jgi:hypothetical protein
MALANGRRGAPGEGVMGLRHIVEAVVASPDVEGAAAFQSAAFDLEILNRGPDGQVVMGVRDSPAGRIRLVPAPATGPTDVTTKELR